MVSADGLRTTVPSFKVLVVDSTAAGDAFNGGLAVALIEGDGPRVGGALCGRRWRRVRHRCRGPDGHADDPRSQSPPQELGLEGLPSLCVRGLQRADERNLAKSFPAASFRLSA